MLVSYAQRANIGDYNIATREEPLLLKPVASDDSCKQYLL